MSFSALAALLLLLLQQAQSGKGSIEGTVVSATTNKPIPGAQLTLTRMPAGGAGIAFAVGPLGQMAPNAVTDSNGRFVIKDLDAGTYRLSAAADGFARQEYGPTTTAQPSTGRPIALIPDRRERRDLYRTAQTDANGRFGIAPIAPGAYKIFAWADIERFSYFDPAVLQRYEDRGRSITVNELSDITVELTAIR